MTADKNQERPRIIQAWADSDGKPCAECALFGRTQGKEGTEHPHQMRSGLTPDVHRSTSRPGEVPLWETEAWKRGAELPSTGAARRWRPGGRAR